MVSSKKDLIIPCIILLILSLAIPVFHPSTSSATEYPLTLTDDLSRSVTITQQPQRIISLSPSNTEILFALGLGDKTVGVTDYCDYPTEATSKPSIGGPYSPNNEAIIALNPDLVLASGITPSDNITALAGLGIIVFGIEATNLNDLLNDIQTVGRITDTESEATALTANMQTRIAAVNARSSTLSANEKPRVMHIMYHDPVWTSGANTFINDMMDNAGGINVFADLTGYNSVSIEAVLARDPQIIVVTAMGGTSSGTWGWVTATDSPMKLTSAYQSNKIYFVESNWLERPGPRVILGLEALVEFFHPGLYVYVPPQEDPTEESVKYDSPGEAAQTISELDVDEAAKLLSDNSITRKERAGLILDQMDTEKRLEIIQAMSQNAILERLPEVSAEKLFELSPQELFDILPNVTAEQLIGETPPVTSVETPEMKEINLTYTSATYQTPRTLAGEWTDYLASVPQYSQFASSSPFTSLMIKPNKDLSEVKATVEIIRQKPAGIPLPEGYPYLSLYFDISVENMQAQEMEAGRVVFKLQKYILDFMSQHKWSVMLNHWNETRQEWIPIPTKRITEDNEFVYYSAGVSGFSTYCITGSREIPEPKFEVSDMTIAPLEAGPGEEVTISAKVKNRTGETLLYPASLWIDQTIQKAQDVEVPAGETTDLTFTVAYQAEGEHQVRIDRQISAFTIKDDPNPPEITSIYPEGTIEEETPTISASYSDSQSGIDTESVTLLLDGNDITQAAEINETGIEFIPNEELETGEHTVSVTLADEKGNETSQEWGFTIEIHPVFPGQQNAARDLDQDGLYKDINGDGRIDFGDVINISCRNSTGEPALSLGKAQCAEGEIVTLPITLYHLENGLSGFDLTVSLENTDVAQIVAIELPSFGIDQIPSEMPGSEVRIRAIDTNNILTSSNTSIVLGSLKIKAISKGETSINLRLEQIQDDNGENLTPRLIPGVLTVN